MRVFLSYNTKDHAAARALRDALERARPGWSVFFAPDDIRVGVFWTRSLQRAIDEAEAFLFLAGDEIGPRQGLEYEAALAKKAKSTSMPVVPVLVGSSSPSLLFFNQLNRVHAGDPTAPDALPRIISGLESEERGETTEPWRLFNPYRGLFAMREEDSTFFFGRETLTTAIIETLRARDSRSGIALIGNSGVGKSSIVRAGVLAALRRQAWPGDEQRPWPGDLADSKSWLIADMTPGERPLDALAAAFLRSMEYPTSARRQLEIAEWQDGFRTGKLDLRRMLDALGERFAERLHDKPTRYVLHIDQGEELYARAAKAAPTEAQRFSELLASGISDERLIILSSFRADYYHRLQEDRTLFAALTRVDAPPLAAADIERAAREPTSQLGAKYEDDRLPARIAEAAASQPGGLPLLSYMLDEMWRDMQTRGDGVLRWGATAIDLGAPLARKADEFLKDFPDREADIRCMFQLQLIHVPREGEPVRKRAHRADITNEADIVEALASPKYRILTTGVDAMGLPTVEIGHEALLREWRTLKEWIRAERDFLIWRGETEADFHQWREAENTGRGESALLSGYALEVAADFVERRKQDIAPDLRAFIAKSDDVAQRRRAELEALRQETARLFEQNKVREWRIRLATYVSAALLACVFAVGLLATSYYREAGRQFADAQTIESRMVAKLSSEAFDEGDYGTALMLALEGVPDPARGRARPDIDIARVAAHRALSRLREQRALIGNVRLVESAAFSPNGKRIVTTSNDKTTRVWDAASGNKIIEIEGFGGIITSAAFSPDGKRIVTASDNESAWVRDTSNGEKIFELEGFGGTLLSAAFSPGGKRIVTASSDGTARIWDAASGKETHRLEGKIEYLSQASFLPDGVRIAILSSDGTGWLWDVTGGREIVQLKGNDGKFDGIAAAPAGLSIFTVMDDGTVKFFDAKSDKEILKLKDIKSIASGAAFSPDWARIVTWSRDGTARVWDAKSGRELFQLKGHASYVNGAAFSPDGARIVTASSDGTARVWDASASKPTIRLEGHQDFVLDATLSPDGARIVTVSNDGTARIWNVAGGPEILRLERHNNTLDSASFSPEGKRIVTTSRDGTARIWDAASGKEILQLEGRVLFSTSPSFSHDGKRIVAASLDGTAQVWDAASGRAIIRLEGHRGLIHCVAFSSNGTRIFTGSSDGTARIWDASSGKEMLNLTGLDSIAIHAAFSPDGERILAASPDGTIQIWDASSGREVLRLKGSDSPVTRANFSSNGARIVTASEDNVARVWDAISGRLLMAVPTEGPRLLHVSEHHVDLRLIATEDNHILVFPLTPAGDTAYIGCRLAPRGLSHHQRLKYNLDPNPPSPPCGFKPW